MKPHETWWEKNLDIKMSRFSEWLGDESKASRQFFKSFVLGNRFHSVLDCGAGLCIDRRLFEGTQVRYSAIDITPKLVRLGLENGSFDCVYCRHVLEHLDGYQTALKEMFRVARRCVFVTFFIKPGGPPQQFTKLENVLHNQYNDKEIEEFLKPYGNFSWHDGEFDEGERCLNALKMVAMV